MKDLLTRALEAHGGLSRWREIEAFQLKVSIGGGLWRLKGLPDGLRDVTLRIRAHRPIVTITPFGARLATERRDRDNRSVSLDTQCHVAQAVREPLEPPQPAANGHLELEGFNLPPARQAAVRFKGAG